MEREDTTYVETTTVRCDGNGGPLGHPAIYLKIADREVMCPYCSRLFVLAEGVREGTGH